VTYETQIYINIPTEGIYSNGSRVKCHTNSSTDSKMKIEYITKRP
jgi:hypothetical protein